MPQGRAVSNLIDNAFSHGTAPVVVRLRHILCKVPYEDMKPPPIKMPKRPKRPEQGSYKRPTFNEQFFVPNNYPYKD